MKKKQVYKIEYTLTEKEGRTIKNCLMYARHRIERHDKEGSLPDIKHIEKLLKEFDK